MERKSKQSLSNKNLSGIELFKTKNKLYAMRDEAKRELEEQDPDFLDIYGEISYGKEWMIKDIVKNIKRKGWTDAKYRYLFSLYSLERLFDVNLEYSRPLTILMLAHEPLIHYVMKKMAIPRWISYDEVYAEMSYALRKAIDYYDVFGDVKFVSYASVSMYNVARRFVDKECKRHNVSFDEVVEEKQSKYRRKNVDLRTIDPFIEDYAEIDARQRVWELLGHFDKRAQIIVMAVLNGIPRLEITKIVNMCKSSVNSIYASVMTEMVSMAKDPDYIKDQKYKNFRYNECRSYIRPTYDLLSQEEYNSIIEQYMQEKTL